MVSVINKLKLKEVVLVGFSMGTAVVVEAANQAPDKVIGVVLVDDIFDSEEKFPPESIAFAYRFSMLLRMVLFVLSATIPRASE